MVPFRNWGSARSYASGLIGFIKERPTARVSVACILAVVCIGVGQGLYFLGSRKGPQCAEARPIQQCVIGCPLALGRVWVLECQLNIAQEGGAIAANRVYIPCMTHENAAAKPLKVKSPMQ